MRRRWKYLGLSLLGLIATTSLVVWLLVGTTPGSQWLVKKLLAMAPSPVNIERIEGRLANRLVLHEVSTSWEDNFLEIDKLILDWSPWPLLWRSLDIHQLELDALTLRLSDPAAETPPGELRRLSWPKLPGWFESWQINIEGLLLQEIQVLRPSAPPLSVQHLSGDLRLEDGLLIIDRLEALTTDRQLSAKLEFGLSVPKLAGQLVIGSASDKQTEHLSLILDLQEAPEGGLLSGPVHGTVNLSGRPALHLDSQLLLWEDRIELLDLTVAQSKQPGSLTGRLAIDWKNADLYAEADLAVHGWAVAMEAEEPLLIHGRLAGSGNRAAHRGSFDFTSAGNSWRAAHLAGDWTGSRDSLQADITNGNWLDGEVKGTLHLATEKQTTARLELKGHHLDPARLAAGWSGSVNLAARIDLVQAEGETQIDFDAAFIDSLLRGVPLRGEVRGRWQQSTLELDHLTLNGDGFALQAQGTLEQQLKMNIAIDDLGGLIPQAKGNLHGRGWLSYREGEWLAEFAAKANRLRLGDLSLDAASMTLHRPQAKFPAELSLTAGEAEFGTVQLKDLQATLSGGPLRYDLTIATKLPDGAAHAVLSGGQIETGWQGQLTELQIHQERAGDWTLVAPVVLQLDERAFECGALQLRSDTGELALKGRYARDSSQHQLDFSAKRMALNTLNPLLAPWGLSGTLNAELACSEQVCSLQASGLETLHHGDRSLPFEYARIDGGWTRNGLKADLAFGMGEAGQIAASLTSAAPMNWQLPEDGQLTLALQKLAPEALLGLVEDSPLTGILSGEFSADWRKGQPERFSLDVTGPLSWPIRKKQPVDLNLSLKGDWNKGGLNFAAQAAPTTGGEVVIQARAETPPQWQLPPSLTWSATWTDLPWLRYYQPPQPLNATGTLQGSAEGVLYNDLSFRSSGRIEIAKGRLTWRDQDEGEIVIPLHQASTNWLWQQDSLQGNLTLDLAERGQLTGEYRLPVPARWPVSPREQGSIQARLSGRIKESGLLGLLMPELMQETAGELSLDTSLAGTWLAPTLTGVARLQGGRGYLSASGIDLEKIGMEAHFEKDRIKLSGFSAYSAPGSLSGEGLITLQGWQPTTLDLTVNGENFTLAHLPELQLQVSPKLKLTGAFDALTLTGEIAIPYFLAAGRSERNPVSVSPDVIFVDARPQPAQSPPRRLTTKVRLLLGDRVLVKMFGLDARLAGQLELTGIDPQRFSGRGEIHVEEGTYATYGVKLKIDKGRAVYAGGPLDNPAIDILALKKIGEVQAGVQIRGTAKVPDAKLYAEPAMADTDILSYIVLGRPLSQAGGETDPLMLAAGALLSAGDSAVLRNRLQSQLGIDTLEAESETGQSTDTVLRLGKYLTPDIYLSYGYALFGQRSEVGLRYRFKDKWEAESKFGLESGADLYYRFEFE